jgi:hypothetical protein
MSSPITRQILVDELQKFVTREAFDQRLEQVDKRFDAIDKRFGQVDDQFAQIRAALHELGADLARHATAIQENVSAQIRIIDEKYADLPDRVARLEHHMLPAPRRTRTAPPRKGRRPARRRG